MPGREWFWFTLLLSGVLLVGLYLISRSNGRWAESDSAEFTALIRIFMAEGRLVPRDGAYPNGYAFQAISTFLLAMTGIETAVLQQLIYPLLAALVMLPAWLMYREVTGSITGAVIGTALLFTQPEFLFVILRSSHEKFTRSLSILVIFVLVRSFHSRERPQLFATYVGLFYLFIFAQITCNNLLANSFTVAIALALLLGLLLERIRRTTYADGLLLRLFYASVICLIITYIFTFYLYSPAQHDVLVLQDTWTRISALFLDMRQDSAESEVVNAYAYVGLGWINVPVYFLVSLSNWVILGASFVIWARQGWRWLWRRTPPASAAAWLLWLLYTAFATQGTIAVIADASGALGSNMQHRLFPSISIVAVALVARALAAQALATWKPARFRRSFHVGLSVILACFAVLSVFKASNEPVLSNKWTFFRANEMMAIEWTDAHLTHNHIWTDLDERLMVAYRTIYSSSSNANVISGFTLLPQTRTILLTDVTRLRSARLKQNLPVPPDALRVYDNGEAELYRLRPRTPYQR
jgi:hypothetical protein